MKSCRSVDHAPRILRMSFGHGKNLYVPEPLALQAAPRGREVATAGATNETCIHVLRKNCAVQSENNALGGKLFFVSAYSDTSHGSDALIFQARKEILIRFVQNICLEYHSRRAVEALLVGDPDD